MNQPTRAAVDLYAPVYVRAPVLEPQHPPAVAGTVQAVLRVLARQAPEAWTPCPVVLRQVAASATTVRTILRRLVACGWADRKYRMGPQPVLVYRLTAVGRLDVGDLSEDAAATNHCGQSTVEAPTSGGGAPHGV